MENKDIKLKKMQKQFRQDKGEIIAIDDELIVVVDRERKPIINETFYDDFVHTIYKRTDSTDSDDFNRHPIIATIGPKRLEGVPLIESSDTTFNWKEFLLQKADTSGIKDEHGVSQVSLGAAEWACRQVEKASKDKNWTDADMLKAIDMARETEHCDWAYTDEKSVYTPEQIMQSLQRKVPTSITLRTTKSISEVGEKQQALDLIIITDPKTNTIIPLNVEW